MRLQNSLKNAYFAIGTQVLGNISSFLVRIVFLQVLSIEYLGLNGLFSNIIYILSLTEMGIGPAIVYSLYKPLADKEIKTVKSLMQLFKKAYIIIGCLILLIGITICPWLSFFVKSMPDIPDIHIFYLLFVFNSSLSYFYAYKRNLLIADQKQYISNSYTCACTLSLNIAQIIFLYLTHSFWSFIILRILATFLENYFLAKKADNLYPFLKESKIIPLPEDIKNAIYKNIKALIYHRVGGGLGNIAGSLIMAKYIGVIEVGIYANYQMLTGVFVKVTDLVFRSLIPSIGNLVTEGNGNRIVEVFKITNFIAAWQSYFISIGFFVFLNAFIQLWLGNQYLFDENIVFFIVLHFYISRMRLSVLMFTEAMGLYWEGRYKALAESILNFGLSLILVKYFGTIGIFIGMVLATVVTCFWIEPFILYKHGLKVNMMDYFINYSKYFALTVIVGFFMKYIYAHFLYATGILNFFVCICFCVIVTNLIWIIVFYKWEECRYVFHIFRNALKI